MFCRGVWHGWPVTDCTAEATVLGLIAADAARPRARQSTRRSGSVHVAWSGTADGGFGSYEAQRSVVGLEWLNPAEMFGDSMTEHSYVECTASCLAALAALSGALPANHESGGDARSLTGGSLGCAGPRQSDGSWRGVWGVQFIYGTFFGVRGLLAAGARPGDPALRLACPVAAGPPARRRRMG